MLLSLKSLPWILLTTIVSVFAIGSGNHILDSEIIRELAKAFSTETTTTPTTKELLKIDTQSQNSFENVFLNQHGPTAAGIPQENQSNTDIAGIDGTGRPLPTPLPSTGADKGSDKDIAEIDGTGGPVTVPGTPKPDTDIAGIDGTGAADSDGSKEIIILPPPPPPPPVIAKSTIVRGTAQHEDGYIVVNGIRFKVNEETEILIDGNSSGSNTSVISNGQIIIIEGDVEEASEENELSEKAEEKPEGVAKKVTYSTQLKGEITQTTQNTITVLGQTVILPITDKEADLVSKLGLEEGHIVEVSGFENSNGEIEATYIEKISNDNSSQLIGTISQLNEEEKSFKVNGLTIVYTEIDQVELLNNDQVVNIEGSVNQETSVLEATQLKPAKSILNSEVERVELQGLITEFTDAGNFKIGDVSISTDLQTVFTGNDRDDLQKDVKIEVEGYVDSNNVLYAEKLLFLVAQLTSHPTQSRVSAPSDTFTWSDADADEYRLIFYTNKEEYDQTFDGDTTSVTINTLPENSAGFYVFLLTKQDGFWTRKIYYLYGSGAIPKPKLTTHESGDILESRTATFKWDAIPGVNSYRLRVINYDSQLEYYDQIFTQPETVTIHNLPNNGADINVSLFAEYNGWWDRTPYDLISVKEIRNAKIISHTEGQQLLGTTDTFIWEDVGAEQYHIRVSRIGKNGWFEEIHTETFDGGTTSVTVNNLPENNADVRVWLSTKHSGWKKIKHSFKGVGTFPNATLTSHENGETLSSSQQTFTWTEVPGAEAYILTLRNIEVTSVPVFTEDYDSFVTSQTIENLPRNGAGVRLTLSTKHNGYWAHEDYVFKSPKELAKPEITSHSPYEVVNTSTVTFEWSDVNADNYRLWAVDRTPGRGFKTLHKQTYDGSTTSLTLSDLPDKANIQLFFYTDHDGWWVSGGGVWIKTDFSH